ncbi:long-chain fatty acid transporter FadL [Yersinia mollaretii]|uniref:Long-chain fatty acid transport protein n=1 Tax=Yersinia mollaretii TaxID=33060 RepID=A0AA36LLM7_YERMO|nr:long-chain fatty acid transporter FadL [Yersinia mollaretii]MDA5527307.1 long-chain fatty acid transporter FadL [Yersinia mollaretii]MDR7874633.1 long-chain fatty acid transporter FadL [Yersinia mollaretii]WQC73990.1 long-chain fatty acid transporter FadL [Yersinia mollaretii]CNE87954.1 long-chain fatty acid outer membrane transporter [Yersinia mollaretii]CNH60417.1 long-chain fatty acid outer membrane transporter [Yersinia mollaretii]
MNQKNLFTRSALAAAIALISSNASAAGFQLNEYSAAALGRSFSGEGAVADNASVGSRNPAAMTLFDRPSFSGGAVYVDPNVDITGKSPLTGRSTDAKNIAPSAWIPNIHFIMPLNEQWAVGASVTSNYGLATEFNDDYIAGSLGGQTDLKTANTNLSAAYRLNENFSFGLGFNAVYADAKIVRHIGELGGSSLPPQTEITRMEGKEWGYGWNAGILYEVDKENRYSFTYRSKVKIDFDGDFSNQLPTRLGGTAGATIPGALTLNLPEVWEVSGYNKVAPQWAIHYSLAYTSWSQFKELKATGTTGKTLFDKEEGFKDVYRIALGTTYYHDDNWTFRTGIAFDDSPVPSDNRTISIPDQDRFWISAGTTYAFNKDASVDIGISYMHGQNVHISEKTPAALPVSATYQFDSKGTAMLYGVNFNYAF